MKDNTTTIAQLKQKASNFVHDRDWRQFHGAKNLSMAISVEASELMELFIWARDQKEAGLILKEKEQDVKDELADIIFAALMFADEFDIDLTQAIEDKIIHNEKKYPIEKAKGVNKKYTDL